MLRDRQRALAAAIFDDDEAVTAHVLPGRFAAAEHVRIYRHSVLGTLTTVLGSVYPVVEKLVGAGFFGYAVNEYLRAHRPASGNLHDFGETFAGFLADFPPAATLPYLADVARLEWAWHRAWHAADPGRFDPGTLASIPADDLPELRFALAPGACLLASPYPIVRIFEANQPEYTGDQSVDLDSGGVTALIIRRDLAVTVEPLAPGDAALLAVLQGRQTLAAALAAAHAAEPALDPGLALAAHIQRGTITGLFRD